jgi:DNA-directed RNA polymerase specialized sigma24 family protein
MATTADEILALTPQLRRHARLLTGSQTIGDEYVRICLELVLAEPERLSGEDLRKELFAVFHSIWNTINAEEGEISPYEYADPGRRLERGLQELPPTDRRALLLVALEGYRIEQTADILGLTPDETADCIQRGREKLGRWSPVETLIIEDESVFVAELDQVLREMGHSVLGVARNVGEALRMVRQRRPGLVLADIELAENDSGIDAARRILDAIDVPLIFVTGFPERLLRGGRPEPAFVMPKPIEPEALKVTIAHVLGLYDTPELAAHHRQQLLGKLSRAGAKILPFRRRKA